MRAAVLKEGKTTLSLLDIPEPHLQPGCVIVRIESVFLTPYMSSLIDGSGGFVTPKRPHVPGSEAIGVVEQVADDVKTVSPGEHVYCDPYIAEPSARGDGEYAFIGCFAISSKADRLLNRWPNGAFATHMLLPAENVTSVDMALKKASVDTLARLGWFGTAHSAFAKTGFQSGQSVAVLGATGLVGVSAVLVALAMGAGRVVAVGRSHERLKVFEALDPRVTVSTAPPGPDDPVNLVIGAMSDKSMFECALAGVSRFGSAVILASLDGPISAAGFVTRDVKLVGSLWFPREATGLLVDMISAGTLPVDRIVSHAYPLERIGEALTHIERGVAPFEQVVLKPQE